MGILLGFGALIAVGLVLSHRAKNVCGDDPEIGQAMAIVGAVALVISFLMIPFSHAAVEEKIENFLELKAAYQEASRDPAVSEADLVRIRQIVEKANAWLAYVQERKKSFLCNVFYPDCILELEPIGIGDKVSDCWRGVSGWAGE